MATVEEIKQAQKIVFKIQSGISVRTDPKSPVGRLVNQALQRNIDLQQSLVEQERKGLLAGKPESQTFARQLIEAEERQEAAQVAGTRQEQQQQFEESGRAEQLRLQQQAAARGRVESGQSNFFGLDVTAGRERVAAVGATAQQRVTATGARSTEFFIPSIRREREDVGREQTISQQERNIVEENIQDFNLQFGNQVLSPKDFSIATEKQDSIERQIGIVEAREQFLGGEQERVLQREALDPAVFVRGGFKGIIESPFTLASFGVGLTTRPSVTITETVTGFKELPAQIKISPAATLGELTGSITGQSIILGGITRTGLKARDLVRTRGLKEIPFKEIIAPEIAKGQTFPLIKKGQTAGQLLQEFKPILPGEIRPAGFTAAPKPFDPITTAGIGSSELPGLFQAPRVSPHFLQITKVGGQRKLFTLNLVDVPSPTVIRVTPINFALAKGVKFGQKSLADLNKIRQSFAKEPLGQSTLPFIKTEKEAILTAGTPLIKTGERFFFRFEDRRIPIQEFKIGDIKGIEIPKIEKFALVGDISSSLSRGFSQRGLITPLEITALSSSVRVPSSSLKVPVLSSSKLISTVSSKSLVPSSISSVVAIPSSSLKIITTPSSSLVSVLKSSKIVPPSSSIVSPPSFRFKPIISGLKPVSFRQSPLKVDFKIKKFPVLVRRFGKFKPVGFGRTKREAFEIGRGITAKTLAASFRVPGFAPKKAPAGFRRKGDIFIEKKQFRLSKMPEIKEIQFFKAKKKKKKKKGGII